MLNPFFLQGANSEQGLVQDLINEHIRMFGVEIYYLPRKYLTEKTIIKEIIQSKFDRAFPLEAYVVNYDGYANNSDMLTKFGLSINDELTLIVSKERCELYIQELLKNDTNTKLISRPKEGDLIYFPLGDKLFEIKFVENEKPFYQLGKNYVYEFRCELFEYEDEDISTGVTEVDTIIHNEGYIATLTLAGIGITANAITSLSYGGLQTITLINDGNGYTSAPKVSISSPGIGVTAEAVAIMTSKTGLTTAYSIKEVYITNPGYGYTYSPRILFFGGGGNGAIATSGISTSSIGIVSITNGGSSYTTVPIINFASPSDISYGTTATGIAVVSAAGTISEIRITNSGVGYTSAPIITISNPSLVGSGSYDYNEIVVGSASSSTAKVRKWTLSTATLEVAIFDGQFEIGETLVGQTSGATYTVKSFNKDNLVDPYNENLELEIEGDAITDFTSHNPFGDV